MRGRRYNFALKSYDGEGNKRGEFYSFFLVSSAEGKRAIARVVWL